VKYLLGTKKLLTETAPERPLALFPTVLKKYSTFTVSIPRDFVMLSGLKAGDTIRVAIYALPKEEVPRICEGEEVKRP
jgi:hypothetical protein